jgi:hypothetical protein
VLGGEAQPGLNLSAVVAGMKDAAPEDPDTLTRQIVEEWTFGEPPIGRSGSELREAKFAEADVLIDVGGDGRRIARWQKLIGWRFLGTNELGEEAAFGEELVDQDRADGVGLLVGSELEAGIRHGSPHTGRLVALADVGIDNMLPLRLDGARRFMVGNCNEVVVHGWMLVVGCWILDARSW